MICRYDHSLAEVCSRLKDRWLNWNPSVEPCPFSPSDLDEFSLRSNQTWEFLAQLREVDAPLGIEKTKAMDSVYNFSATRNCEIKFL